MEYIIDSIDTSYIVENEADIVKMLHEDRKDKISKIKQDRCRHTSIKAGLMLQDICKKKLNIEPSQIDIGYTENGKPYIRGFEDFQYNISHTENAVVIAYGDKSVGVDIENVNRRVLPRIFERFSDKESEYINTGKTSKVPVSIDFLDSVEKRAILIWTMKEAFLKCKGIGLSIKLSSFDVLGDLENVKFHIFQHKNYIISICSEI